MLALVQVWVRVSVWVWAWARVCLCVGAKCYAIMVREWITISKRRSGLGLAFIAIYAHTIGFAFSIR